VFPIAERLGDPLHLTRALLHSGRCYTRRGMVATSEKAVARSVALGKQAGDATLLALAYLEQGEIAYVVGEWNQAQAHVEQAADVLRGIGSSSAFFDLHVSLGRLALAQGKGEEGRRHLEEGLGLAQRGGMRDPARHAQRILAEWDVLAGRPEAACARLEPLLAGAEETYTTWALRPVLAWAQLEQGEVRRAEELVGQTLAAARAAGVLPILVDALGVQARLASRRGRWQEAETALEEALVGARAMPSPYAEVKALWVSGQLESARGNPVAARKRFEQALAICDWLGEGLYRPRIEQDRDRISPSVR
jgi:tetratricopeptide (TPR) repeat protein